MRWSMMDLLFGGLGRTDLAITLNRIAVGAFFMLSGYHKLFNAERHRTIVDELNAACLSSSSLPSQHPGGSGSNSTSRSMSQIASTIGSIYRRRSTLLC